MRLPCDRYIRFCTLRGTPSALLYRSLEMLGYPPPDVIPELMASVLQIQSQCAEATAHTGEISDRIKSAWQLTTALGSPELVGQVEYLVRFAGLRKFVDLCLVAGMTPAHVSVKLKETKGLVISDKVVALYQHLMMDLSSLSQWEADAFFDIHLSGDYYRAAYLVGEDGAMFYSGGNLEFDAEAAFGEVCQTAYVKFREVTRGKDAARSSAAARNYTDVMVNAYKQTGQGTAARKLRTLLEGIAVATVPLESERLRAGLQVTGVLGARLSLAEVQDALTQVERLFNERAPKQLQEPDHAE